MTERRRGVVSLATDESFYPEALDRLERSLHDVGFGGDFWFWPPGSFPKGCPAHLEVPFAFKPFCLAESGGEGGETLLWLDSSCVVVEALDPLFETIETEGYVVFKNLRAVVGEWSSDLTLAEYGLSREQACTIPEVNAAALGLDLHADIALRFLEAWLDAASREVPFRGTLERLENWEEYQDVKWNRSERISTDPRVRGHRHDQTVASILAHRLGMELTTHGLQRYSEGRELRPGTMIAIDRSMRLQSRADVSPEPAAGR